MFLFYHLMYIAKSRNLSWLGWIIMYMQSISMLVAEDTLTKCIITYACTHTYMNSSSTHDIPQCTIVLQRDTGQWLNNDMGIYMIQLHTLLFVEYHHPLSCCMYTDYPWFNDILVLSFNIFMKYFTLVKLLWHAQVHIPNFYHKSSGFI